MTKRVTPAPARTIGDLGATLAEYALIFTFLAVLAIGGTKALTNFGKTEVANQSDCVSKRPPPASCQFKPATTTTLASTVVTTATTVPPTTVSTIATTTTTAAPVNAPFVVQKVNYSGGVGPQANASITVTRAGVVQQNVLVTYRYDITTVGPPAVNASYNQSCTTNGLGQCTVNFTSPYVDTNKIVITPISIATNPPPGSLPAAQTVTYTYP